MKYLLIATSSIFLIACQGNTQNKAEMKTQKDSISYSIGMNIGKDLKRQSIDVDPQIVSQGIKDVLAGGKTLLTDEQQRYAMTALQKSVMAQREVMNKELGEKNKKEGEAFLAENKKKDGVKTTASGLQYKVLEMGDGKKPQAADKVSVNYRGTLIDGTEFDSSYKRGQPTEHPVNGFIKGWTEALQLMPVGSKWQLFIPSDIAYGERGYGESIGPNATLIFEIELLAIK